MKIYQVTVKKGDEIKITYCDYRPKQNDYFIFNGEKWKVIYFI